VHFVEWLRDTSVVRGIGLIDVTHLAMSYVKFITTGVLAVVFLLVGAVFICYITQL